MKSAFWLVIVVLASVCCGIGCAHVNVAEHMLKQKPIAREGLPRISIDREASMVVASEGMPSEFVDKDEIIGAVETYWNNSADPLSKVEDARVIIQLVCDSYECKGSSDLFFLALPPVFVALLFGAPTDLAPVTSAVRLQIGNDEYLATQKFVAYAGLYYPGQTAPKAISKSVIGAVRKIADKYR